MSKIQRVQNAEKMKIGILLVNVNSQTAHCDVLPLQYSSTTELACKVSNPWERYFVSIKLIRETKQNEKALQYIFSHLHLCLLPADCLCFKLQRNHTRELHSWDLKYPWHLISEVWRQFHQLKHPIHALYPPLFAISLIFRGIPTNTEKIQINLTRQFAEITLWGGKIKRLLDKQVLKTKHREGCI